MRTLPIIFAFLCATGSYAQSASDSMSIKQAAINYVQGFYTSDSARIKAGIHPQLVKRIINNGTGASVINNMSRAELINISMGRKNVPDRNPAEEFKAKVVIYDISNGIAQARVDTNKMPGFFDYMQLGIIDGEWKVINVLWAFKR